MERLEVIKLRNNHDGICQDDIDWLIEQAERAQRMEMMYENTGSIMNRRHQIDKIEQLRKEVEFWKGVALNCDCGNEKELGGNSYDEQSRACGPLDERS